MDSQLVRWAFLFALPAIPAIAACSNGAGDDAGTDSGPDVSSDAKPAADAAPETGPSGDAGLGAPCDPVLQNCADSANKCTYVKGDAGYAAVCVAPTDFQFTTPNGQACDRTVAGDDDCVKGQICIPSGLSGQFICWAACAKDGDCGANERCVAVTAKSPRDGVCEPTCTLFGTDCPQGESCGGFYLDTDGVNTAVVCHGIGSSGANQNCTTIWDCGANLTCLGGKCLPDCDSTHTCTSGTCTPAPGLSGAGTCQ